MKKVSIIGSGQVGSTLALLIAQKELADVVLIDVAEGIPQGKALDLNQAAPIEGFDSKIIGSNDYKDISGSDIVVITAGLPRKPGMTREDLLKTNAKIIKEVSINIKKYAEGPARELSRRGIVDAENSKVIVVTNPLDVMSYLVLKTTGFDKTRVMGMAGVLDSARFSYFIAKELDVSVKNVNTMVLGSHGDSMIPIPRYSTVSEIPITELLSPEKIKEIIEKTKNAGAEIVKLLSTGSAFYAPAGSISVMVESILKDRKKIISASVFLKGEYGIEDTFIGVPIKLGKNGIEEIIELDLTSNEKEALKKSAEIVKEGIRSLE